MRASERACMYVSAKKRAKGEKSEGETDGNNNKSRETGSGKKEETDTLEGQTGVEQYRHKEREGEEEREGKDGCCRRLG